MNINPNVMKKRISRRHYLNKPLTPSDHSKLIDIINELNETSGLTLEFMPHAEETFSKLHRSYGLFTGVHSLILMKGLKKDSDLKEKVGYYGEQLVLKATELSLGTCWVGTTYDRKNKNLKIPDNESLLCVITIGYVNCGSTKKEHMIRHIMQTKTKSLSEFYKSKESVSDSFLNGLKAVQMAPSSMNKQPVLFTYKNNAGIAYVNDANSLIDLGIAKLHFELATGCHIEIGNPGRYEIKENYLQASK